MVPLCHSVPLDRAEHISRLVQLYHPKTVAVCFASALSTQVSAFGVACDVYDGPASFLSELDRMPNLRGAAV